jgi:hypothetical protein
MSSRQGTLRLRSASRILTSTPFSIAPGHVGRFRRDRGLKPRDQLPFLSTGNSVKFLLL